MIVASPLGLRQIMGGDGDKHQETDFLASIEVLVLYECDVMLMQNWSHVLHIMDSLHRKPFDARDTDFSRVRYWALEEQAAAYRQTVVVSAVGSVEQRALLSHYCRNYAGQLTIAADFPVDGVLPALPSAAHMTHSFTKLPSSQSIRAIVDDRFNYFVSRVLPSHLRNVQQHTLIVVPRLCSGCATHGRDLQLLRLCPLTQSPETGRHATDELRAVLRVHERQEGGRRARSVLPRPQTMHDRDGAIPLL